MFRQAKSGTKVEINVEIHLHRFNLLVNYISCRDLKLKMYEGFGAQRTFWKQTWWT